MKMYHKDSKEPVDVHASQVETMENRGWSKVPPVKTKKSNEKVK